MSQSEVSPHDLRAGVLIPTAIMAFGGLVAIFYQASSASANARLLQGGCVKTSAGAVGTYSEATYGGAYVSFKDGGRHWYPMSHLSTDCAAEKK